MQLDDDFFICMNPACNVAYYSVKNQIVDKSKLKRELYFKQGTGREIICYCNNVDRNQIEKVVKEHGLTIWEDVMGLYTRKIQEKCEYLNPTGLCCRDLFTEVVEEIKHP